MFRRLPLTNPIRVVFVALALEIPESVAAAIEAMIGILHLEDLKIISAVRRPVEVNSLLSIAIP